MVKRQQQPIASIAFILGLSTLIASCHFASDLHSPTLFLFKALLQISTFIVLILLVIYAIFLKQKWLSMSVLYAVLINIVFIMPRVNTVPALNEEQKANTIQVATFSTLTRTSNVTDIIEFSESESPDLLCLQEVAQSDRASLVEQLSDDYPYHIQNNNNQITFSRLPLTLIDDAGFYLASEIKHPTLGELMVINAHMPRPYLSEGVSANWKSFLSFIDNDSSMIVCGDLNITPNNSLYEVLKYQYQLQDALMSGFGFTYPSGQRRSAILGPLIRIDYIMSRHLSSIKTRTINASSLSDHKAVISELITNKNNVKGRYE